MIQLGLRIGEDRASFKPGETLSGAAEWTLDRPPASLEARLYWRTEGAGDPHVETIGSVVIDRPGAGGRREFKFALPEGPYSFDGRLLSLRWGVELVALPQKAAARAEFVLAPDGGPVALHRGSAT